MLLTKRNIYAEICVRRQYTFRWYTLLILLGITNLYAIDVYKLPGWPGGGGRLMTTERGLWILPQFHIAHYNKIQISSLALTGNSDPAFGGAKDKATDEYIRSSKQQVAECRKNFTKLSKKAQEGCERLGVSRPLPRLRLSLGKFIMLKDVKFDHKGRILLCGQVNDRFYLARFLADGSVDGTFNRTGEYRIHHREDRKGACRAITILPDNSILAAGASGRDSEISHQMRKFTESGKIDTQFNGKSIVNDYTPGKRNFVDFVAVLPDGKFIAAGAADSGTEVGICWIKRLMPNGEIDRTYGEGVQINTANSGEAGACVPMDVFIDSQQRVIIAHYFATLDEQRLYFSRVNSNGVIDTSFGSGGSYQYAVTGRRQVGYCAAAVDKQDNVVILVGDNLFCERAPNGELIRLRAANGTPDPTFPDYLGAVHRMYPKGFAFDAAGNLYVSVGGIGGGMTLTTVSLTPDGQLRTDWGKPPRR